MAWIPAVIAGVASLAGSAYQAHENRQAARQAQEFSKQETDTSIARRTLDLKNAGLNPMLAYMGSGSVGGAQSAAGVYAGAPNYGESFTGGFSAGSHARKINQEVKNLIEEMYKINWEAGSAKFEAEIKSIQMKLTDLEYEEVKALTPYMVKLYENLGAAEQTLFKEYVSPYIPDFAKLVGTAAQASGAVSAARYVGRRARP